jgi:hypothetical protein
VLLTIAAAVGYPFAPFVVGEEGDDYQDNGENCEHELHGGLRIAWNRKGWVRKKLVVEFCGFPPIRQNAANGWGTLDKDSRRSFDSAALHSR